jgi:hypothetical protein
VLFIKKLGMTCLLRQPTCLLWDYSFGSFSIDYVSCIKLAGSWWKAWLWSWIWWCWWGPRELKSCLRVMIPTLQGFDSSIFKQNPFHLLPFAACGSSIGIFLFVRPVFENVKCWMGNS